MNYRLLANLCAFSYMDFPHPLLPRLARGAVPIFEVCSALLAHPPCKGLSDFDREVLLSLQNCRLSVIAYINQNSTTGFAAYAFYGDEGIILAMRGSESGVCVPSSVDWIDNFTAPLWGSMQYKDAWRVANRYKYGNLLITGHSKGGHNALYALSSARNPNARAVVFNAQGFARRQLTGDEARRLKTHAINCVTKRDIVGALAWHPEKRLFCVCIPYTNPHSLNSFAWNSDGTPLSGHRTLFSRLTELGSRLIISGLHTLQSGATIPYQRFSSVSQKFSSKKRQQKQ